MRRKLQNPHTLNPTPLRTRLKENSPVTDEKPKPTAESPSKPTPPVRQKKEISLETRQEILRLAEFYGTRRIATRVGQSRKLVRRVLSEEGRSSRREPQSPSKLAGFAEPIEQRVLQRLTISRIYREIRELGYRGHRTILAQHVRQLQVQHAIASPKKKVKRRFETEPGREMQADWSPFWLSISGQIVRANALSVILCCSRKLFVAFFRDERQHSLLEGLARAFEYFDGCSVDLVVDNMATAVLGRLGPDRKPLWHPAFAEFARHYAFNPVACAVRDPDRKGKVEKPFRLVDDDFLKASSFDSWDDLNEQSAQWLDHTPEAGNLRVHGTTGLVPNEAYLAEREFLIRLPRERFPVYEDSIRIVDNDSTLSIGDRKYTVPSPLANRNVPVRLFAHHFEVLDANGHVVFSRTYAGPEEKRRLLIDPTHYVGLPRRPKNSHNPERLDESFLRRFPSLAELVDGLKLKMKTLAPVHLRRLLRLATAYGEASFLAAATRAQSFRRFDALAVQRILERDHPEPPLEPISPLSRDGAAALGEVDPGSLEGYAHLDEKPASNSGTDSTGNNKDSSEKKGPHGS